MAGLCTPLPTLRRRPCGRLRTARGQCGSLLLHRKGLPPSTPCRSPGALRKPTQKRTSLDHLIGAAEQHRWHFEAERFRSLEIDTQLGRLVKRDISRIGTSKNLIDEVGEAAIDVR